MLNTARSTVERALFLLEAAKIEITEIRKDIESIYNNISRLQHSHQSREEQLSELILSLARLEEWRKLQFKK